MTTTPQYDSFVSAPDLPYSEITDTEWLRGRIGNSVGVVHRIVRHLASGGMGHVFLAEHVHIGVYAAVKVPRLGSEPARACIAREARMLAQLQHPNIVSVLDVGQLADGLPYMLMEYVRGLELDAWLDASGSGTMNFKRSLRVLKQVAGAVDYLHAQGIVHADIKPSNILIDSRAHDFVKLIDFGIAYREDFTKLRRGVIGTPAYMAPEQARGEACGPASDVYGIAALALELLTGKPPYDYSTAQAALTAILTRPPALPSHRGLMVPGLDDVFARGLHHDPSQRFAIATDLVDALEEVLQAAEARPTLAPRPTAPIAAAHAPEHRPQRVAPARGTWPPARKPQRVARSAAQLQPYREDSSAASIIYRLAWRVVASVATGVTALLGTAQD